MQLTSLLMIWGNAGSQPAKALTGLPTPKTFHSTGHHFIINFGKTMVISPLTTSWLLRLGCYSFFCVSFLHKNVTLKKKWNHQLYLPNKKRPPQKKNTQPKTYPDFGTMTLVQWGLEAVVDKPERTLAAKKRGTRTENRLCRGKWIRWPWKSNILKESEDDDWKRMVAKLSAFGISEFPFNYYGDVLVSILVFSAIIDLPLVVQNIFQLGLNQLIPGSWRQFSISQRC